MEWYREHSHVRVIRELKEKSTSAASIHRCIIKEKTPGYDKLVNRFKFLSKWCADCITAGQPVPIEKIKKHKEMIDNVDNEEYADDFGEKMTKNPPKKNVSKENKRSQASLSSHADGNIEGDEGDAGDNAGRSDRVKRSKTLANNTKKKTR